MAIQPKPDSLSTPLEGVPWHALPSDEVAERLEVNPTNGLDWEEAVRRAAIYEPNEILESPRRGPVRMLLAQFTDFMILVLLGAGVISGMIGEPQDTVAIVVIVVLNALIGFVQEYRAERAVLALRQLAAPTAWVRCEGRIMSIPARDLVLGDVVSLEAGSMVPADLRLVEAAQLKVDEAALTGESQPVEKVTERLEDPALPLGDRRNMAYKGTVVTYGRGAGLVVATGMSTELGSIAALLSREEEVKTPLQKRLARFGQRLALAVLTICAIIFAVGILRGEPPMLMFLTAVSLAVAAIPEALPAVVTISLALGARKMVRQNALVRRLPAVETLGSVTYICSDKTGTLTQNRMRAEVFYLEGEIKDQLPPQGSGSGAWFCRALALSNDAVKGEGDEILGDPTEVALYQAALQAGFDKEVLLHDYPRIAEIPFDAERKRMSTLHLSPSPALPHEAKVSTQIVIPAREWPESRAMEGIPASGFPPIHGGNDDTKDALARCIDTFDREGGEGEGGGVIAFVKGAPETLLERCVMEPAPGDKAFDRATVLEAAEKMALEGYRVLGLACRQFASLPAELSPEVVEDGLKFLGLVGLVDPPRPEAFDAVALCKAAGITPVMITGDHPSTARAVASRLGIIAQGDQVMSGSELARLPLEAFENQVEEVRVYARVAPEQKIKIVRALQDQGEFVAMTGDGVNDAPALKRADIGVAMGKIGTDVAREASHMVLLDDNFATIVAAVREGRRIFDNIRKFIKYTMTSNSAEIWTLFLAPFLGLPIPLLPIHILWINLVTDGLPGLALAVEPEEKGVMYRPPRPPNESIFAHGLWQHMLWVGLLMGGVSVFTQAWAYHSGSSHWQTMVFTVLTLSQMGHVLAIRSERESLFRQGLGSNLPLLGAVLLTFLLQLATIYLPLLTPVFKTQPLSREELAFCLVLSTVVFFAVEIEKWLIRRGKIYQA